MKTNKIKYIAAILLIATLTACKVSQDIETPKDAFPVSFRNAVSTDTVSVADQEWKKFFTETALVQLIDSAVTRNNNLQVAQKNIEAAQWQLKQSKWNNVPQLDLKVSGATNHFSENSLTGLNASSLGKNHIEDYNASLGLSWEADIWGKMRSMKQNALAQYLQSGEAKKALQTLIVANVSKGYYNLLMLDSQLLIARKNLVLNDSTIFVINLQYESGQVTSLAKQQAEAQQLVAAQLIPELEQNIAIQENALSILAGTFPSAKQRGAALDAIPVQDNLSVGIPSSLLARRPDVKSAELELKAANAKVGIADASRYPALNITAAGGLASFESSNWFTTPASLFGTIAGSLTQPLLQNKRLKAQYEIAKINREKAVIQFRQSVLVAAGEVADALVRVDKLKAQYTAADKRATVLITAVKNSDMLFKNGMAGYLEVIIAQGNLLQSQIELAYLKKSRLEAEVELYRALGGGWK